MTGQEYVGFRQKGKIVEHNVVRKSRSLGSLCTSRFYDQFVSQKIEFVLNWDFKIHGREKNL